MKKTEDLVGPFLDYCTVQRRLTADTVRNYRFDMAYFLKFLARQQPPLLYPDQVTKETLEEYLASMSLSYKVKTIKRKMASLHSFFTYLVYSGILRENPFAGFHLRMKEGYRKPKSLSLQEMELFLRTVYADPGALPAGKLLEERRSGKKETVPVATEGFIWCRDLAILELLFAVGLRVSELCGLRFADYDSVERSFHIIGKGNRERTLFLGNPEAITAFDNYLLLREASGLNLPCIFVTRLKKPMSAQGVRNIVTKYAGLAGIHKNITPHVFRHSFASLLLESGVEIKYIQDFLGHSSISTTQIYLHISDEEKKKILATKHPRGQMSSHM